jgi:hypothetical protein
MKFKTTVILFAVFVILLAVVLLFEEFKGKDGEDEEDKLIALSSDDVQKITLKRGDEIITFEKSQDEEKEEWILTEPFDAKADKYETDQLAENFSNLRIERVVEEEPEDLEKYEIPQKEISLWFKNREKPIKILIGSENSIDSTFFAKREDETRVVLIPSHLKSLMEKKIALRTKETQWEAEKKEEEWFFNTPVKALAKENKITGILNSLAGMKAKEFISEDKKKEDIEKFGLDRPDYEIALTMPLEKKEFTFFLHKKEDKLYATSSLSPKIIEVEDSLLSELEEEMGELRDRL